MSDTKAPKQLENKEHAVIAAMIASRVKGMTFKTPKQIRDFRKDLLSQIDVVFDAQVDAWSFAKERAKRAKLEREIVQGEICARWAQAQLRPDDVLTMRGVKMKYQFVKFDDTMILCVPVKYVVHDGDCWWDRQTDTTIAFGLTDIQKIYHDGKWLDIYALASGS